jgi:hypothetical protein
MAATNTQTTRWDEIGPQALRALQRLVVLAEITAADHELIADQADETNDPEAAGVRAFVDESLDRIDDARRIIDLACNGEMAATPILAHL